MQIHWFVDGLEIGGGRLVGRNDGGWRNVVDSLSDARFAHFWRLLMVDFSSSARGR